MNAYPSAAEIDRLLSYDAMAAYAKAAALHFGQFARAA